MVTKKNKPPISKSPSVAPSNNNRKREKRFKFDPKKLQSDQKHQAELEVADMESSPLPNHVPPQLYIVETDIAIVTTTKSKKNKQANTSKVSTVSPKKPQELDINNFQNPSCSVTWAT